MWHHLYLSETKVTIYSYKIKQARIPNFSFLSLSRSLNPKLNLSVSHSISPFLALILCTADWDAPPEVISVPELRRRLIFSHLCQRPGAPPCTKAPSYLPISGWNPSLSLSSLSLLLPPRGRRKTPFQHFELQLSGKTHKTLSLCCSASQSEPSFWKHLSLSLRRQWRLWNLDSKAAGHLKVRICQFHLFFIFPF